MLYESIVDEALVDSEGFLKQRLFAADEPRRMAQRTALAAQSDVLDAHARRWVIADVSAQTLRGGLARERAAARAQARKPSATSDERRASASAGTTPQGRAGSALARFCCALAPGPELSLALLDWSFATGGPRETAAYWGMSFDLEFWRECVVDECVEYFVTISSARTRTRSPWLFTEDSRS